MVLIISDSEPEKMIGCSQFKDRSSGRRVLETKQSMKRGDELSKEEREYLERVGLVMKELMKAKRDDVRALFSLSQRRTFT